MVTVYGLLDGGPRIVSLRQFSVEREQYACKLIATVCFYLDLYVLYTHFY